MCCAIVHRMMVYYLTSCIEFASMYFFFFKQKTAYEMRISDWSSDVCSSDRSIAYNQARLLEDRRARNAMVPYRRDKYPAARGAGRTYLDGLADRKSDV